MDNIGERIKEARRSRGLSQEAVARRADISVGALRAVEQGGRLHPQYTTVMAIAHAMEMSLSDLVGDVSPKAQAPPSLPEEEERRYAQAPTGSGQHASAKGARRGETTREVRVRLPDPSGNPAADAYATALVASADLLVRGWEAELRKRPLSPPEIGALIEEQHAFFLAKHFTERRLGEVPRAEFDAAARQVSAVMQRLNAVIEAAFEKSTASEDELALLRARRHLAYDRDAGLGDLAGGVG